MSAEPLTFELALQILREDNPRAGEDVLRIYTAALRDFAAAEENNAVRAGEATEFAAKLKSRGYYTGDEGIYAASLRHLQREFLGAVLWGVDPNEVTIASTAHGTSIVDWALARREEDRIARLDEELCGEGLVAFCGASRYEEAA